jgi:hypothetical protein
VIPNTAALVEQKVASMTAEQAWWLDVLNRGALPYSTGGGFEPNECRTGDLFANYITHAQQAGVRYRKSETAFGMFLRKIVPRVDRKQQPDGSRYYVFPPLPECRAFFAKKLATELRWNNEGEQDWTLHPEPRSDHGVF